MTHVATINAPKAIGPYSQAVETGGLLFISGQLGIDPATSRMAEGGVEKEAVQALENLKSIAAAAGASMSRIVKTTILLDSMDDFASVNKIYGGYFDGVFPARACYEVSRLPAGGKIEIEAIVELEEK